MSFSYLDFPCPYWQTLKVKEEGTRRLKGKKKKKTLAQLYQTTKTTNVPRWTQKSAPTAASCKAYKLLGYK